MFDYVEPPPIISSPPAVIDFAKKNNVYLLDQEPNIKAQENSHFRFQRYKVYPCYTDYDTCTILYKKHDIRFATKEEEKRIYWIFR